ncbi:hypothetical protein ACQPW3_24530 [Actinosynnema sp. CA-248983]
MAALFALVRQVANTHLPDVEAARAAYLGPATDQVTVRYLTDQGRPARRRADGLLEWRLAELPVAV